MVVVIADTQGNVRRARLRELLPDGFALEQGPG
jgi:cytidine deaminase